MLHAITVTRTARYATLGPEDGSAREVWFVLHGYGQLAAQFLEAFTPIDDGTRLIVAPEALNRCYLVAVESAPAADRAVGATWMTREDRVNEITDYVRYLDAVAERVLESHRASSPRIVVFGFSQGTATAARWVTSGAVRPAHLIFWGGSLPPDVTWAGSSAATSLDIVIGSRDRFVTDERLADEERRLREGGVSYRLTRYEGGHSVTGAALQRLAARLDSPNA